MVAKFREDIQGLRTLSVLAVALFHVDLAFMPGGFLGVDIFFVISGFLITGNLISSNENKTFSMGSFFIRRIRRLMPAAVTTILLTLMVGYFILSSTDYAAAGGAGIHALLFSSNILFWLESGYFDAASHLKPFLHYWSLSVEEQFYFIWPLLVGFFFMLGKRAGVLVAIVFLSIGSLLALELYFLELYPSASFFLMPFRIFEFGAGALVSVTGYRIGSRLFQNIAVIAGLILICASFVLLDANDRMPGFLSLIPILGCVLVLLSPEARTNILIANRVTTSIGNASYSIYLVHWPIIVFYKILVSTELHPAEQIGLVIASLVLGYLLHFLIEEPFRRSDMWKLPGNAAAILGSAAALCATVYLCSSIWANNGWSFRFQDITEVNLNRDELRQATLDFRKEKNASVENAKRIQFYVIGDSHGKDFANTLNQMNPSYRVEHFWIGHLCQGVIADRNAIRDKMFGNMQKPKFIENCEKTVDEAFAPEKLNRADVIVLANQWLPWADVYIPDTLKYLKANTKAKLVVVTTGPEFKAPVPTMIETQPALAQIRSLSAPKVFFPTSRVDYQIQQAAEEGVAVINSVELLCPDGTCPILPDVNAVEPYYLDEHHMTLSGNRYLAEQIRNCSELACKILVR